MNFGIKFYVYLAGALLAGLSLHHTIYQSGFGAGAASTQKKLDAANEHSAVLEIDKANLNAALANANAATALAKAESEQQLAKAAVLIQQLADENRTAGAQLDAWRKKFTEASKQPDCVAFAKAQVCASLSDY